MKNSNTPSGPALARDIELARFGRGARGTVVIALRSFKGRLYVDARLHAHLPNGELTPTTKGVTFRRDEIGKVISALGHALKLLEGTT